jgi:hypothetical protein
MRFEGRLQKTQVIPTGKKSRKSRTRRRRGAPSFFRRRNEKRRRFTNSFPRFIYRRILTSRCSVSSFFI